MIVQGSFSCGLYWKRRSLQTIVYTDPVVALTTEKVILWYILCVVVAISCTGGSLLVFSLISVTLIVYTKGTVMHCVLILLQQVLCPCMHMI